MATLSADELDRIEQSLIKELHGTPPDAGVDLSEDWPRSITKYPLIDGDYVTGQGVWVECACGERQGVLRMGEDEPWECPHCERTYELRWAVFPTRGPRWRKP